MSLSKINKNLTLDNLLVSENMFYDKKSAKIELKNLANEIMSFANTQGGILALDITDSGVIEGTKKYGINKYNKFQKVINTFLRPAPFCNFEIINIKNNKDEDDQIILYHIEPSMNKVIRNTKDEVYCRYGDSSIKLTSDQIKSLEYDRNEVNFENQIVFDSCIDEIDDEIVDLFKKKLESNDDNISVLKARGILGKKKAN